ncbi:Anti-sigma factor [Tenacibaculum sediminilitoris]|uniref:FecR family protein n=1 Tax=Tenacibaculum sediminilitoris TaxID=1820334 RepID=UPI0038956064
MTKKTYNTIHDFLNDVSFKNWAFNSQLSDVSFWDFWLKNNSTKKNMAYEARDILLGINFKESNLSEEKIAFEWNKLEFKLKNIQDKKAKNKVTQQKYPIIQYAIAASIAVILCFSIFTYFEFSKITHKTAYGEVLELKLIDGTQVILNSNSSISYKKNDARKVWLKGEAYFKVHKKETSNAKFWVHTNDLVVEVYGTQFNVNTLRKKTRVYLEEGNIWLTLNNGEFKKMSPGNYIEYSSKDKKILIDKNVSSKEEQTSWKNGKLVFYNYTLEKALNRVSDTYGVSFKYKTTDVKNILITGTVPTHNLDICLNAIRKSTGVAIKKESSNLVVYKN